MTLHEKIDAILCDPVFAGRLWYIARPQAECEAKELYGVWQIIGGPSFQTLEGDTDIQQARVQISVYVPEHLGTKPLVDTVAAVNTAMKAANALAADDTIDVDPLALYNYSASVPIDGQEPDTGMFYTYMDFYCWVQEP